MALSWEMITQNGTLATKLLKQKSRKTFSKSISSCKIERRQLFRIQNWKKLKWWIPMSILWRELSAIFNLLKIKSKVKLKKGKNLNKSTYLLDSVIFLKTRLHPKRRSMELSLDLLIKALLNRKRMKLNH